MTFKWELLWVSITAGWGERGRPSGSHQFEGCSSPFCQLRPLFVPLPKWFIVKSTPLTDEPLNTMLVIWAPGGQRRWYHSAGFCLSNHSAKEDTRKELLIVHSQGTGSTQMGAVTLDNREWHLPHQPEIPPHSTGVKSSGVSTYTNLLMSDYYHRFGKHRLLLS